MARKSAAKEPESPELDTAQGAGTEQEAARQPDDTAGQSSDVSELAQLRAELAAEREARVRLEGRLDAERSAVVEPPPKEFTRAELQTAVDNGQLTEARRDEILEEQATRRLEAKLEAKLDAKLAAQQSRSRIQTDLDRYIETVPGLKVEGHENRVRVAREYEYLTSIGQPPGPATELAALRAIFGPAEKIRETTRTSRDRYVESGGGSSAGSPGTPAWQKGLSPRQVSYYGTKLENGFYTDTDDPIFQREIAIARGESPTKVLAKERAKRQERRVQ